MSAKPSRTPRRSSLVVQAHAQAQTAADAAAVTIRGLTEPREHAAAADVFTRIWALEPGRTVVPSALMRVMAYEGCYVVGVFDDKADGRLIGAATAFLASDGESGFIHLHSHVTGMLPEAAGRHAGFAVKLHQRAWALDRGIRRITWTFDPLVRANAYFNLAKLGADATTYLIDFYGEMPDGVNLGQGSDRLLASWALDSPRAIDAASGARIEPTDEEPLLASGRALLTGIAPDSMPGHAPPPDAPGPLLIATPTAIQTLRQQAPERALHWRLALRSALTDAVANGYRVTGFTRTGWYLLEHHEEKAEDR